MSTTATPPTSAARSGNAGRVVRFVATRVALSLVTLWLLSVLVFAGGQLLPGDIGRAVLGPLADARAVAALNHQLGADRPLLTQYVGWITHFVRGDMGMSYVFRTPVAPFVVTALALSAKLGLLAFVVVVPLGIAGGVWAAMHAGRWIDRTISITGLSATVVPEFVSSIVLILIFGIWLQWLPIEASYPPDASVFEQLRHLVLPVLPLVFVFFGYIARMARAGTVEALDADYTRTAILKGLPQHVVIWRHVLRNALLPTITVAATQLGYMIGGLVVVETLFHYQGIGSLIYNAAKAKDFPMLEAGVLTVGVVYTVANLAADALYVLLNPRLRVGGAE
ncbi:ABC transporter permease [Paraburkholderia saeva]|uniref:Glutathione transport system permease protein GsiC n=1 Tax=Paraburkholderia saeva TaxID=2777537 RepID=A0A9N8RTS4_9BURK|nr:ABC transporter permease [Paraburkholderia saeva]CAG4890227.1 Glutathione transport system permease protein GsiC [Paraburkholderia saeva]CAG4893281.1 Glutathione transport system permease protein GsiC [Paraburkholderia saeva]CAG4915556.1 Glutathione transport system permease protein GsiC [Paraburkholderia saeva]